MQFAALTSIVVDVNKIDGFLKVQLVTKFRVSIGVDGLKG